MERIVILTEVAESDEMLIRWLRRLFPECKIQVQPIEKESVEGVQRSAGLGSPRGKGALDENARKITPE